ncbi:DUF3052 family protein [Spirosoma sp.]|uniref:DUF3052 family protein n=1 Tax=Spirosoma sp. TaxID=1899569 RepID=UPI003B3BA92B
MIKPVSEKMGVKPGSRVLFVNAPADAIQVMDMPEVELATDLNGNFDSIHFFAISQNDLHEKFLTLKSHLKPTGTLWLAWPKAGQNESDLTLQKVIEIGYNYGLVESKTLSINPTWSAIKFTHPREGKDYQNSYGKLNR